MMCKQSEDEKIWRQNVQQLLDLTDSIPLGLYECPKPYHRLLTPETLKWAAETGRIFFHKDTCCSVPGIKAKLDALKTAKSPGFKFFNANIATLLLSIQMGANGFCGIAANCYPHLLSWLTANRSQQPEQSELLQRFLSIAEPTVANKYPQSAKMYLRLCERGFKFIHTGCRVCKNEFNEEEVIRVVHLKDCIKFVRQSLKEATNKQSKSVLL